MMRNIKLKLFVWVSVFAVFLVGFTYKNNSSVILSFNWLGENYKITLPAEYNIIENTPSNISFTSKGKLIGCLQNQADLPHSSKVLLQKDITTDFGDGGLYALLLSTPLGKAKDKWYEIVALINSEEPKKASYFWLGSSKESWLKDMELFENIIKSIRKENR